eukprot:TRINITY_DN26356_c0_g1_i1.p1 TRINITY_DN26356_c0_g1~~TRINITY_DN26356_c0_g1_i1.p1  ORF type:complete len:100 (-),score=5.97 TRINITY_DN26356_c0_g1_i1:241-540(-)
MPLAHYGAFLPAEEKAPVKAKPGRPRKSQKLSAAGTPPLLQFMSQHKKKSPRLGGPEVMAAGSSIRVMDENPKKGIGRSTLALCCGTFMAGARDRGWAM